MSDDRKEFGGDRAGRGSSRTDRVDEDAADQQQATRVRMAVMHRRWIARKKAAGATENTKTQIPAGSGSALPADARSRLEPQLGADLSGVRVHTSSDSQAAANSLNARAFTVGGDVHFGAGEFAPGTKEGDRLLAHELTHVVQGQRSGIQRKAADSAADAATDEKDVSQPGDAAEVEADETADRVTDNLHGKHAHGGAPLDEDEGGKAAKAPAAPISAKLRPGVVPRSPKGAAPSAAAQPVAAPGVDKKAADLAAKWKQAKQQFMQGQIPPANLLPPGNEAGIRRLHDIMSDKSLPPDVRTAFLAEFRAKIEALKEPPPDLHKLLREVAYGSPDKYLRKGTQGPSADYVKQDMGSLKRAISLKALCFSLITDAFYRKAAALDRTLPPERKAFQYPMAQKVVELISSGKLSFNPDSDLDSGRLVQGAGNGYSGWFFAGKDADTSNPKALQTQLAVGDEYKAGYLVVECPPELAAHNQGGGHGSKQGGASRPTALDLCLAPEGKLNPNADEPVGRTAPTQQGQKEVREVVLPPMPLGSLKRGALVRG